VTANTEVQLKSKTWRELSKWHQVMLNRHWFDWSATKFANVSKPQLWYSIAQPWSKEKPEGFAGTHENAVLMLFDEASAIYDKIWEFTEGALTQAGGLKIFLVLGNPTMTTGKFAECFGKNRHRWITYEVDSRTARHTDKKLIQEWIDDYGIDSDFVRVRVLGQEPRDSVMGCIGLEAVRNAMGRVLHPSTYAFAPKIMGVDIARSGEDRTMLITRQGRVAYDLVKKRGLGGHEIAGLIASKIEEHHPDHVFVDNGNGGDIIVETLHRWGYEQIVTGVWFAEASALAQCNNKRTEMAIRVRDWLPGASIPDDNELRDDLVNPLLDRNDNGILKLEALEAIKKRALPSPDGLSALGLTFAHPVVVRATGNINAAAEQRRQSRTEYDELEV
jgi:hypothetical protein